MASTVELFDAMDAGDVERVRALLDADPTLASARDEQGVSAILHARYRLDRALVAAVAAYDPPQDVFDAAAAGDLDGLVTLLDMDPGLVDAHAGDGFTPLHLAAFFGRVEAVQLLLDRGATADEHATGWMTGTPLHSAASASHADAVALLLAAGADPNARQSGGWTPLHSAAANGNVEIVEALRSAGADPSLTNDEGSAPSDLASTDEVRTALGA